MTGLCRKQRRPLEMGEGSEARLLPRRSSHRGHDCGILWRCMVVVARAGNKSRARAAPSLPMAAPDSSAQQPITARPAETPARRAADAVRDVPSLEWGTRGRSCCAGAIYAKGAVSRPAQAYAARAAPRLGTRAPASASQNKSTPKAS